MALNDSGTVLVCGGPEKVGTLHSFSPFATSLMLSLSLSLPVYQVRLD